MSHSTSIRSRFLLVILIFGLMIVTAFLSIMVILSTYERWVVASGTPSARTVSFDVMKSVIAIIMGFMILGLVFIWVYLLRPMERMIERNQEALLDRITHQQKTETALRDINDELDRFFRLSLDLLCIADMDGYLRRVNTEWEWTLGYKPDELVGRGFLDLVHPDDRQATLDMLKQLDEQKPVLNFINRYRRKDGRYRLLEWRAYPSGKTIYAAARDITDRGQKERAKLLSEFITSTSHELRTPLTVINSSAYLLNRIDDTVRRREKTDQILDQVRYLDRMITQLQEMAGLNQIRDLTLVMIDICGLVERFIAYYPQKRSDVEMGMRPCGAHDGGQIVGNMEYLMLAIGYLVDNAVRYSPTGGTVWLSVERDAVELRICVEDHGTGIADEHVERVFDQFYKADSARTQNNSAAGMGLAMVRRIMDLHSGRVSILSHKGNRTVFALIFPLDKPSS
jgi:PAS domain S-box-containing protein